MQCRLQLGALLFVWLIGRLCHFKRCCHDWLTLFGAWQWRFMFAQFTNDVHDKRCFKIFCASRVPLSFLVCLRNKTRALKVWTVMKLKLLFHLRPWFNRLRKLHNLINHWLKHLQQIQLLRLEHQWNFKATTLVSVMEEVNLLVWELLRWVGGQF